LDNQTIKLVDQLAAVLQSLAAAHEAMLELLHRKRAALRTTQYELVTETCAQENAAVQRISELEKRRLELVAQLTLQIDPQQPRPMKMSDLAERLPEPQRGRLLVLRRQLLEHMEQVRRQTNVARRTTESLAAHMQGLLHTITAACTGASVYDRSGGPPRQSMALSTFHATG